MLLNIIILFIISITYCNSLKSSSFLNIIKKNNNKYISQLNTNTKGVQYELIEYNTLGERKLFNYDKDTNSLISKLNDDEADYSSSFQSIFRNKASFQQLLRNCFLPGGYISEDYYKYTYWRIAQRFVSATSSVFGTQALLLALGFKSNRIGVAAATTWVLKDALGKVSRIYWASKYGRKFDSDAKKWRFRSSILFACGNGFEIFTYLVPSMFLVTAALANAMKQMAMLTSSATRNAIYKSFSRSGDNIGDITAKGEAQIAVIDLLGMFAGILISRIIDTKRNRYPFVFFSLIVIDLFCIFNEIRSVVFNALNFGRAGIVLSNLLKTFDNNSDIMNSISAISTISPNDNNRDSNGFGSLNDIRPAVAEKPTPTKHVALTPQQVASVEQIFMPTKFGEDMFKVWSTVQCSPEVLKSSIELFGKDEKIIITLHAKIVTSWLEAFKAQSGLNSISSLRLVNGVPVLLTPEALLHVNATSFDIFRAILIVYRILMDFEKATVEVNAKEVSNILKKYKKEKGSVLPNIENIGLASDKLTQMISSAYFYEKNNLRNIINFLRTAGWDMGKFLSGTIKKRVEWEGDQVSSAAGWETDARPE
jgi:hypothetical protein